MSKKRQKRIEANQREIIAKLDLALTLLGVTPEQLKTINPTPPPPPPPDDDPIGG